MHFTSKTFSNNSEPSKFKLILKYFFFWANIIPISFAGSLRRKFFNCPLKLYSFHFCNVNFLVYRSISLWRSIKFCMLYLPSLPDWFWLSTFCLRDTILTLLDSLLFGARGVATRVSEGKRFHLQTTETNNSNWTWHFLRIPTGWRQTSWLLTSVAEVRNLIPWTYHCAFYLWSHWSCRTWRHLNLLLRADETQKGRNSSPQLQPYFIEFRSCWCLAKSIFFT